MTLTNLTGPAPIVQVGHETPMFLIPVADMLDSGRLTSGQVKVTPVAAILPNTPGRRVGIQSSYQNTAPNLIVYVGAPGGEVIELIAGDTQVFNIANAALLSLECSAGQTAIVNWWVEGD
jgi:hypothetical protein